MSESLSRTPLYAVHVDEGAKLAPFAGFEMPVVYDTILNEHAKVRGYAGLFDVSHMGEVWLRGPQALDLAQALFTNDVSTMIPGRVRYGILCQDDGGVVDDVTLYRVSDEELMFCVNASNIAEDLAWMRSVQERTGLDAALVDESESTGLLAIQGPAAREITHRLLADDAPRPKRWRFAATDLAGVPVWLSRTGYTGEDGYEIYCPAAETARLWKALREAGGEELVPAGLGARDTLRTEMAYPLYGHELDRTRTPVAAGLERFISFGRGFIGEDACAADREHPVERLVGLSLEGRRVARTGFPILTDEGKGVVTSGTWGPSVERSIAIGYVPARFAGGGTRLEVEIRGRPIPCEVVETPFYGKS